MNDESSFDWSDDKEFIVMHTAQGIAVYPNARGDIVIRAEKTELQEEDPIIVIPRMYVDWVISAIRREVEAVEQEEGQ